MYNSHIVDLLQIDNHKERGDPASDTELNEVILDEAFRGGAAEAENDHILKIAQKAGKYPTAGKINIAGAHSLNNFWRHGVHDVTNQRNTSDNRCGLIDEGLVVTRN